MKVEQQVIRQRALSSVVSKFFRGSLVTPLKLCVPDTELLDKTASSLDTFERGIVFTPRVSLVSANFPPVCVSCDLPVTWSRWHRHMTKLPAGAGQMMCGRCPECENKDRTFINVVGA
jgi:hypothetical protein